MYPQHVHASDGIIREEEEAKLCDELRAHRKKKKKKKYIYIFLSPYIYYG
jgi:hypothetical protein